MKKVIWTKYGGPGVLKMGEAEKPSPKDKEILIQVIATSVTLGDCEMRNLSLPLAFKIPLRLVFGVIKPRGLTLGQEFSGIVEAIGKDVTKFKIGDEISGQTGVTMGAYSQYMTQAEKGIMSKKPGAISFEQAACVPLGGLESQYFIKQSGLGKSSKVLVIGAGGSIGTMGIQLLKLLGAEVTGVDIAEKFEAIKEAGADYVIDYTKQDYMSSGKIYDGILDVVGKTPLKKGLAILNNDGVYMHANPKISHMLFRKILSGSGNKKILVKIDEESQNDLDYLCELLNDGKIRPIIDKVMSLDNIVDAHKYVEAGKKRGNLVIKVDYI